MQTSVVPLPTRGAGRMVDWTWPHSRFGIVGGGANSVNIYSRINAAVTGADTTASINTNNGGINWAMWRGRLAAQFFATIAAEGNGAGVALNAASFHPVVQLGDGDVTDQDDWAAFRFSVIMAFPAGVGPSVRDFGLGLVAGTSNPAAPVVFNANPGMELKLTNANELTLFLRTVAGGLTSEVLLTAANGYNCEQYHAYELLVTNATPSEPATMRVIVDRAVVATKQWDGVANMPAPQNAAGNQFGFSPFIAAYTGGGFFVNQARVAIAPTVAALR
jgi:hypothetical protein